ncbi:hypothetical protein CsSME_00013550 [Camellia sinensis var. sinensis]
MDPCGGVFDNNSFCFEAYSLLLEIIKVDFCVGKVARDSQYNARHWVLRNNREIAASALNVGFGFCLKLYWTWLVKLDARLLEFGYLAIVYRPSPVKYFLKMAEHRPECK